MNVVFSSSDLYAKCTGVAIFSLLKTNRELEKLTIYLLITDMTIDNQKRISEMCNNFNRKIVIIQTAKVLQEAQKELGLANFKGSLNTYARVIANKVMPSNVHKALFVDSDLLFNGSLKEIEELDMKDNIIAGVPEIMLMIKSVCYEDINLLEKCQNYVNYGVVYINLDNWRKLNGDNLIKNVVDNSKNRFKIAEQSILNLAFKDYTITLQVKYNYYTILHGISYETLCKWYQRKKVFEESEILESKCRPIILHFVGDYFNRPWYKYNICRYKDLYMKYYHESPWGIENLDAIPSNFSLKFRVYYSFLIFLRKNHFDMAYFKFRYVFIQWLREKIPSVDKLQRRK